MTVSVLLTDTNDQEVREAVAALPGWRLELRPLHELVETLEAMSDIRAVLLTTDDPTILRAAVEKSHERRIAVIMGCKDETARRRAVDFRVEEWYRIPASPDEIAARIHTALGRVAPTGAEVAERAERVERQEMLYDALTGLPTLPVMIERMRGAIRKRGELVVMYLNFVRYSKIEEIYGWEKLDAVLETTARSVHEFLDDSALRSSRMMVGFTNDDDFIFFHVPAAGVPAASERQITELASRLERHVAQRLEEVHGEEIAALFDIYIGSSHVYYNPKIRLERLIYRGIREAANAAKSVEERERARKVSDLKATLRARSVYIDYHPIITTDTGEIFGYEALARGVMRSLRSPEVMFEVAAEADLIWELSRLCRSRAVEGMASWLTEQQLLFLNVDPHDFSDPTFDSLETADPERVVIEITERTAIKDYPKFRERLQAFRDRGFRFAVDDAGSGYAGLGSIANLEPDFIKQNLVETMVKFAEEHDAMVIAEGVERAEELETVKQLGVPLVQGFFLHRPDLVPTFGLPAARAPR